MAAADPQLFFLTPPPRHLAELRIDTAPSAVAFSAPCVAAKGAGRKRHCLVPGSSVRKRMLLELAPFEVAPSLSSTPPAPPSPTASLLAGTSLSPAPSATSPPSPMASQAGVAPSSSREFSFGTVLRVVPPASPGNMFKFAGNAASTPAGSEASSVSSSFLSPLGQAPKTATGVFAFLAAPKTPTATGPTANGGFVFAAPSEGPLTPTTTNTLLASPKKPLTPIGSTASGGSFAASIGKGTVVPLISLKPARTGDFAFPSPGPACSQNGSAPSAAAKESMPLASLPTPPSTFRTLQPPPPLPNSGDGSHKRPSLFHRRAATSEHRKALWQLEEQQQSTPPPQKVAKTNSLFAGEAFPSSLMSGSSASPCCTFFTSPSKKAARQEAKKANSEASQSPAGSHCSSPATPEKVNKQEQEVEASSSPRECALTSPAVVCSGAEMVVRVTCKCGVHKEFCFDHRL